MANHTIQLLLATKSAVQPHSSLKLVELLSDCLTPTYNAIRFAEESGVSNRKGRPKG